MGRELEGLDGQESEFGTYCLTEEFKKCIYKETNDNLAHRSSGGFLSKIGNGQVSLVKII